MAGDLITGDYEIEFRGLLTGGDTDIALVQIEGIVDLPAVRSADQVLLRRHGAHPGDDYAESRQLVVTYELHADTAAGLGALVTQLQAAFRPGGVEEPFVFQLPGVAAGSKALVWARPKRRQMPVNLDWYYGMPTATIELIATDPLVYGAELQSAVTTLPSAGGGLAFPLAFPRSYGVVSTGGGFTAQNDGSFDTDITFRIDGPAVNPRIESLTAGKTIAVNISLDAGEFLLVDTKARSILLNGTASRYDQLDADSQWFTLAPGPNSITFRASTATVAVLSATWRSAWL